MIKCTLAFALVAAFTALGALSGCHATAASTTSAADTSASQPAEAASLAATATAPATTGPAADQLTFASPQQGADALIGAAKSKDSDALHKLLGPSLDDIISADPVQHANDLDNFSKHAAEAERVESVDDSRAIVHIGQNDWPFPIPLMKTSAGQWYFDTPSGKDEILNRRIGEDELDTIGVAHAYVDAQREYASQDRIGDSVLQYAQQIKSTPGKHDGLYWPVADGEAESPFGPLVAQAQDQGYGKKLGSGSKPYHGYFYRILTKQGPATPAGAYDYIINGRMIAGFALVAYPEQYGNTGIMTFIVNHQGKVYQRDLGPGTADIVSKIDSYNPDDGWAPVQ
jgi:hypothetical protein